MSEPTAVKRTRHFTPAVFWPSVALILVFVLLAAAKPEGTNSVIANISSVVVKNAGWCYILAVAGFVVFALVVAVSRKGDTVLGPDDAEPEYSRGSWFAMLFAAGMGIGLVSIQTAVSRYGGSMTVETENGLFRVNILLNL